VQTVQAQAVIVPKAGLFTAETAEVGRVSSVLVHVGSDVGRGQQLATLAVPTPRHTTAVASPVAGVVVSVDVRAGDIAQPGATLFLIAPGNAVPMAIGLYPATKIDQISIGQKAEVAVNGVDPSKYGFALGHVAAIGPIPVTNERLSELTGNASLLSLVSQLGPLREVDIKLERSDTPSGLKWSVGRGPSSRLPIGVRAAAKVTIGEQTILHQAFG
jgi:HlyD family secretion protein